MFEFEFNIYPSTARQGQWAIAVTNKNQESLVIGFTSEPEKVREAISGLLHHVDGWVHNKAVDYHTFKVEFNLKL